MGKRKTIPVERLVDLVNDMLTAGPSDPGSDRVRGQREGAYLVLEAILHETGNYRGFRYLTNLEGYPVPGVRYSNHGYILPYPDRFNETDNTRRQY